MRLNFSVPGTPVQQGNHRRNQYGATYETSKNHAPWRDSIVWHAREARPRGVDDGIVFDGPVHLQLTFVFQRPKNHYRTGKYGHLLRDDAPLLKLTAPDIDKLERSVLDALAIAGIYRDDAQVASVAKIKIYGDQPGLTVWAEAAE